MLGSQSFLLCFIISRQRFPSVSNDHSALLPFYGISKAYIMRIVLHDAHVLSLLLSFFRHYYFEVADSYRTNISSEAIHQAILSILQP